jgi:phosphoglucosamine mutase
LQILQIMTARQKPLSALARCWTRMPQVVTNVRVREKRPLEELDGVTQMVSQAEKELKSAGGRILLRYSGTEPKVRLLVEGPNPTQLDRWSKLIVDALRKQVGA